MLGRTQLALDFENDSYIIRKTVELDALYSQLEETRLHNKLNRDSKSGWMHVAEVPEEEFHHNKDLLDMLFYEEMERGDLAKKSLRKYLVENSRFKMSSI